MQAPRKVRPAILFVCALAFMGLMLAVFPSILHSDTSVDGFATLSGRVYEGKTGEEPPLSIPLQNVRVDLHCSNENYPDLGAIIDTQYTNDQGWYGLDVDVRQE